MKAPGDRPCPSCGSTDVVQVQYGYPSFEMAELERKGEIILGGCVLPVGEEPEFYCRGCRAALPWVADELASLGQAMWDPPGL